MTPHDTDHSTSGRTWSDLDLAAYLDAELDPETAGQLAAALRCDPGLRQRLSGLRAADAAVLAFASAEPADRPVRRSANGSLTFPIGVALAATVVLVLTAWLLVKPTIVGTAPSQRDRELVHQPRPDPDTVSSPAQADALAAHPNDIGHTSGQGTVESAGIVRVSLGAARPRPGTTVSGPAGPATPAPAVSRLAPLRTRDRAGDGPLPETNAAVDHPMLIIARGIRSHEEGLAVLDLLDPREQVRACEVWARVTRTRPMAFQRLAVLAADPEAAAAARRTVEVLAAKPEFVPWLRMHGLLETGAAGPLQ